MPVKIRVHTHLRPTELQLANQPDSFSGVLYLEIGDLFFPARGGGAYVLEDLAKWMENAMQLMLAESEVENVCMETSSKFKLCRAAGSDDVRMRLYHRGELASEHMISYKRYLAALRGAAKRLLQELKESNLNAGAHADNLRNTLANLELCEADLKVRGLS